MRFFTLADRLRPVASLALIVVMCGMLGTVAAQPRPDVTLWLPADSITTGEPFDLTIESSTPAHRGIAFPPATTDTAFGDLEVLSRSDVHTRRVGAGYAIDSVSYTLRTSVRDSVRIPAVPIRVDAAVGTLTTHTVPRTVGVRARHSSSLLAPFGGSSPNTLGWFVLAVAVGGVLYGAAHLWGRSRENSSSQIPPASVPSPESDATTDPYETATQQLRALRSRDLSDPDAIEAVHVALAEVVRTYLSQRWNVATGEHTTADLLDALDHHPDVPPDAVEPLRTVLERVDRVKFAAARPAPATIEDTIQATRTALNRLEDTFHPVPPSHDAGRRSE